MNLKGDELKELGFPEGKVIGVAIRQVQKFIKELSKEEVLALLLKVRQYPENFLDDEVLSPIARLLADHVAKPKRSEEIVLKTTDQPYAVFGQQFIEPGAIQQ